jgi:hypothetical protein
MLSAEMKQSIRSSLFRHVKLEVLLKQFVHKAKKIDEI